MTIILINMVRNVVERIAGRGGGVQGRILGGGAGGRAPAGGLGVYAPRILRSKFDWEYIIPFLATVQRT